MKLRFGILILFVIWCLVLGAYAQAFDVGGYYKNDMMYLVKKSGEGILGDVNKLRIRFDSMLLPNLKLHLEPQYVAMIKSQDIPLLDNSQLNKLIWDRSYLKINLPLADITAGKQRIAWGTGHVFNPTDVFNPFVLSFAVAEEERPGVESIRIQIPIGATGGIDAAVLEQGKEGIKAKTTIGSYDISVSYADLTRAGSQIGFDAAGELFGLGVRGEAALINPGNYLKYVLGWGYTLDNGLGMDMEYYYSGLAIDYVYFGLNKNLDEITVISLSLLGNAQDNSFIIYPSYRRNIMQNLDLSFEALFGFGREGAEFSQSNMLFSRLRFSF